MTGRKIGDLDEAERDLINRWRLVLGKSAETCGIKFAGGEHSAECEAADEALGFLFEEERRAGSGPSNLTVPRWIDAVSELFPREASA